MPPADSSAPADASVQDEPLEDLTPEDVRRLAEQAGLDASEQEIDTWTGDLGRLLGYAQQLDAVETEGVEPMPPGAPAVPQHLRKDEAQEPLSQQEVLENAPDASEDGFFRTPAAWDD